MPVVRKYLVDSQSAKSEFIEKRVKILKAARAHEGLYQCIANNSIGTVMKNAQVEVISRTVVRIASKSTRGLVPVHRQQFHRHRHEKRTGGSNQPDGCEDRQQEHSRACTSASPTIPSAPS